MTGRDLLQKLIGTFQSSYDIEQPYDINGDIYDAYARFYASSASYVLMKKAELWRTNCFEHVFFRCIKNEAAAETIHMFKEQIEEYIEPKLVRQGKRWPEENHMYTYITAIYICEGGVSKEAEKLIRSFHYIKNYKLTIRGYSEARILVFDLQNGRVFGNRAAKVLVKGYKKLLT